MHSILQTSEWGDFKASTGDWFYFKAGTFLVLAKKLPYFNRYFFYIPEPFSHNWQGSLEELNENLKPFIKKYKPIFVRIEPLELYSEELKTTFEKNNWVRAFEDIQPSYRQWIDLKPSTEEILMNMKPKGRYNIKVAQKHEIQINKIEKEDLESNLKTFHELMKSTAKRDQFSIRPFSYFLKLTKTLYDYDIGTLYIGYHQNKPICGEIVSFYNKIASYLYGVSGNEMRQAMAPYLMHWTIMQDAKAKGIEIYDLLAVAPVENENHKHAKLSQFKRQFGGKTIELIGGWDMVLSSFTYNAFKLVEKMRRK
ncbi:MAG: peptidoglycan bridge formation glycyltransferase FemA/FemB family protein [Patescibacteria group bacterium]